MRQSRENVFHPGHEGHKMWDKQKIVFHHHDEGQ